MWGNLKDVGSTIQRIGKVVAPPASDEDEDDEYYEEGDEYYEDEDGQEYYQEEGEGYGEEEDHLQQDHHQQQRFQQQQHSQQRHGHPQQRQHGTYGAGVDGDDDLEEDDDIISDDDEREYMIASHRKQAGEDIRLRRGGRKPVGSASGMEPARDHQQDSDGPLHRRHLKLAGGMVKAAGGGLVGMLGRTAAGIAEVAQRGGGGHDDWDDGDYSEEEYVHHDRQQNYDGVAGSGNDELITSGGDYYGRAESNADELEEQRKERGFGSWRHVLANEATAATAPQPQEQEQEQEQQISSPGDGGGGGDTTSIATSTSSIATNSSYQPHAAVGVVRSPVRTQAEEEVEDSATTTTTLSPRQLHRPEHECVSTTGDSDQGEFVSEEFTSVEFSAPPPPPPPPIQKQQSPPGRTRNKSTSESHSPSGRSRRSASDHQQQEKQYSPSGRSHESTSNHDGDRGQRRTRTLISVAATEDETEEQSETDGVQQPMETEEEKKQQYQLSFSGGAAATSNAITNSNVRAFSPETRERRALERPHAAEAKAKLNISREALSPSANKSDSQVLEQSAASMTAVAPFRGEIVDKTSSAAESKISTASTSVAVEAVTMTESLSHKSGNFNTSSDFETPATTSLQASELVARAVTASSDAMPNSVVHNTVEKGALLKAPEPKPPSNADAERISSVGSAGARCEELRQAAEAQLDASLTAFRDSAADELVLSGDGDNPNLPAMSSSSRSLMDDDDETNNADKADVPYSGGFPAAEDAPATCNDSSSVISNFDSALPLDENSEKYVKPPPMPIRQSTAIIGNTNNNKNKNNHLSSPPNSPHYLSPKFPTRPSTAVPGSTDLQTSPPPPLAPQLRQQNDSDAAAAAKARAEADEAKKKASSLESQVDDLQEKLQQAERHIIELQQQAAQSMEEQEASRQRLLEQFQEKESRLLAAAAEERESEMQNLRGAVDGEFEAMRNRLEDERASFARDRREMERVVQETNSRAERAERQLQLERSKQDNTAAQFQKQQEREARVNADKVAQAMAELDERDELVEQLQGMVQKLQSKMNEHQAGAREAEDEMEELHHENEELRHHYEAIQQQNAQLQSRVEELQADSEKLSGLKMELRMVKEERDRERAKSQHAQAFAQGSTAQLEEERDGALAQVQDLKQQLAAAVADLKMAQSDTERVIMARDNLQMALESFQSERDAELGLLEEQRREAEEATAAAHAAALEATHEAHEAHIRDIQSAADMAVRHSMDEIKQLESKLERFRAENVQMRRSLDEAIHRLQTTQEDVVDRVLMKNILMDWLTKTGVKERKDVLEVMASLLHFTEEEKDKVHLHAPAGTLGKVVGSVAAPLPPSRADVEHLEGNNVREKWVNFLLAETDDE